MNVVVTVTLDQTESSRAEPSQVGSSRVEPSQGVKLGTSYILTEVDEEPTVALPLVRRQCQDAGHVVVQKGVLLLKHIGTRV